MIFIRCYYLVLRREVKIIILSKKLFFSMQVSILYGTFSQGKTQQKYFWLLSRFVCKKSPFKRFFFALAGILDFILKMFSKVLNSCEHFSKKNSKSRPRIKNLALSTPLLGSFEFVRNLTVLIQFKFEFKLNK